MNPLPLGVRFFQNRSLPAGSQTLVNLHLETQGPDSKSPIIVKRTPGKANYKTFGTGPIRGLFEMSGELYIVSGNTLYNGSGASLGTIAGSGLVGLKYNDRESGPQLVICNGTTTQYVYTVSGGLTTTTLTGPAYHPEYQDGYFVYDWSGTGKWFISAVLDGTTYDSLEYGATNSRPDNVLRVISNHEQMWVFGEKSYEIYYNQGNLDFPFVRISEATNDELGLGARWSLVEMDNTIYWVGSDREVYRASGYTAQQISDPSISEQLKNIDLSQITAFTYTDGGHKYYQINLIDKSLVFDSKESVWHVRARWSNGKYLRDNIDTYVYFDGLHLVGDISSGQVYVLSKDYYLDSNQTPIRWEMITPPVHNNGSYIAFPNLFMDFEPGVGKKDGTDPTIVLSWSNDARTWSTENRFSIGKVGNYTNRAIARRLGGTRHQRIFKIAGSDPIDITIMGLGYGA